jgi:hypothetical protein
MNLLLVRETLLNIPISLQGERHKVLLDSSLYRCRSVWAFFCWLLILCQKHRLYSFAC